MGMLREAGGVREGGGDLAEAGRRPSLEQAHHRAAWRMSLTAFGWSLWKTGRAAEAVASYSPGAGDPAGAGRRRTRPTPTARDRLANCETNNAAALSPLGRLTEARACCDRAIAIREELVKGEPGNDDYHQGLAESLMRSGGVRAAAGDPAGAAADWRRPRHSMRAIPPERQRWRSSGPAATARWRGSPARRARGSAPPRERSRPRRRWPSPPGGGRRLSPRRLPPGRARPRYPLRSRDDFRLMMMDLAFPAEPFAVRVDEDFRPVPAP